jgi:hypothetical protein
MTLRKKSATIADTMATGALGTEDVRTTCNTGAARARSKTARAETIPVLQIEEIWRAGGTAPEWIGKFIVWIRGAGECVLVTARELLAPKRLERALLSQTGKVMAAPKKRDLLQRVHVLVSSKYGDGRAAR